MARSTDEAKALAVVEMYLGGKDGPEVADAFGLPRNTVYSILARKGVARRTKAEAKRVIPAATEHEIASAYALGQRAEDIAAAHGLDDGTVRRIVRRVGGRVKTKAEANRRHACDHHYFDAIDTEAKAYWLGFLMADGCVSGTGYVKVGLAAKDRGQLEKLRAALQATYPIGAHTARSSGKTYPVASLILRSDGLAAGLARHGVTPRKTHTATPPALRADLMRHFWRGVFDGDGCICLSGRAWVATLVGSRATTEAFAAFAREACGTTARAARHASSRTISHLQVGGNLKVARLLAALYDGATVYLDRKHARYLRAIAATAHRLIAINGVARTVMEWCAHHRISRNTYSARLRRGWSPQDAATILATQARHAA
jgi:hypothetical protein